jgi:hypothetical protein
MADKPVTVTLTLPSGGVTIDPMVVGVSVSAKDRIKWQGGGCRIKIELNHPEHFSLNTSGYAAVVIGTLAGDVRPGTYHYGINVLSADEMRDDQLVADAYTIDPDYKVDR